MEVLHFSSGILTSYLLIPRECSGSERTQAAIQQLWRKLGQCERAKRNLHQKMYVQEYLSVHKRNASLLTKRY